MFSTRAKRCGVGLLACISLTVSINENAFADNPKQNQIKNLPKGVQYVTTVEGISEYKLPNGLRVLLVPDESKPTITVNVTYLVGSRHENYGETGMAHLLEHLLFKGTPKHPVIYQELSQRGARPNGTTWYDRTNYFETFPASDDNLAWALGMEADRMVNSYIAEKDLKSEMTVVRNEFESGENRPFSVLLKRFSGAAYDWHSYGKTTIGNRSDIENVNIGRLQAFYKKYYQPDNAVLVVAGRIDANKTLAYVNKYFAPIPKPKRVIELQYTVEPMQDGERSVTIRRVGDIQIIAAGYHISSAQHPDAAPLNVLSVILGDTPSGRLHKALVQTSLATSVGIYTPDTYAPSMFLAYVSLRKDDSLPKAQDELLKVLETAGTTAPTDEEVKRAKVKMASEFDLLTANTEQFSVALSEAIAMGDWRLLFWNRDKTSAVTPADVQRVAAYYLKPSNRTVAQFIPTDQPNRVDVPAIPDFAAQLKDYKGSANIVAGESFDPSQENIDKRTQISQLASGMKLALLPKKTRGEIVNASLQLHFGSKETLQNKKELGIFTGAMLQRGTEKLNRQEISEELDRLKATVNFVGGADGVSVIIRTVRPNLPDVLKLVADNLRKPTFPLDEFTSLKRETLANIEGQRREPQSVAMNALGQHFNIYEKGDPRYVGSFEEQIERINGVTQEGIKQFHKDFYGASAAEFSVIGDFDAKEIASLVNNLFGDWKSTQTFARLDTRYQDIAAVNKVLITPDKANAIFLAQQSFKLRDDDPDYPAMEISNYLMGGGFLSSRLSTRIRQKDGLSYSVGTRLSVSSLDEYSSLLTYAIYAPQNVEKLENAFREELKRALKDGFTKEEVSAAKQGLLDSRKVNRSQDEILAAAWTNNLYLGRTFKWSAEIERKIAALTPEQIRDAMRRRIDPDKMTVVKAGDFSKKP